MNEEIREVTTNNYEEVLEKAKGILKAIESRGFKAYIVNETARKIILKEECSIALLATNAPFDLINMLFSNYETYLIDNLNIAVHFDNVPFIIKKFYRENKDGVIEECDLLDSYLGESDFTINALAMDSKTDIIDNYSGYKDLMKKRLDLVDHKKKKLLRYPSRALELINLVASSGYKVKDSTIRLIKRSRPIKGMAFDEVIKHLEIKNIIEGENKRRALNVLRKTNVYKDIPVFGYGFYEQIKRNEKIDCDEFIVRALVGAKNRKVISDEDIEKALQLTSDYDNSKRIFDFCLSINNGYYSKISLFNAGLDIALKGNKINRSLKLSSLKDKKINKLYKALEVKSPSEIKYFSEDILHEFRNLSVDDVDNILQVIAEKILNKELMNDYYEIKEFVSNFYRGNSSDTPKRYEEKADSNPKIDDYQRDYNEGYKKEEPIRRNYYDLDYQEERLRQRELENLSKELEKETSDIVNIVVRGLDIYEDEKERVAIELKEAYKKILIRNTSKYERLK